MANRSHNFSLTGGEDLVTPALGITDGKARFALNYEQNYNTGYTRINGYRDLVKDSPIPGEGPIRGVHIYDNDIYVIRNKTGGLAAGLYKATPTEYRIGSQLDGDDEALWGTNIIVSVGGWTEITNVVDSVGDPVNELLPDGYYEFVNYNFKATTGTSTSTPDGSHDISGNAGNMYAVNGAGPMFEFDGTQVVYHNSTYTPDVPMHIEAQGNRLALGFRAGEVAISVAGDPSNYNPVSGAGSVGVSDHLTGLMAGPDGVLFIFCKDRSYVFYGMEGPLSDATLKQHNKNVGAYPYTRQMLAGHALFFDTWGLTDLQASDRFGDVVTNALSKNVEPLFRGVQPQCSTVIKTKSQYRAYFKYEVGTDTFTRALIATLKEDENLGFTHAEYPFEIHSIGSGEITSTSGIEECTVVGTKDGEVYQVDIGNSFDSVAYSSSLVLPFNYLGSSGIIKKIRKVTMNVECEGNATIQGSADFSFGQKGQFKDTDSGNVLPAAARWGVGIWNNFLWGQGITSYVEMYLNGHGETVSVAINSTSNVEEPHTLKDMTFIYQTQRIDH